MGTRRKEPDRTGSVLPSDFQTTSIIFYATWDTSSAFIGSVGRPPFRILVVLVLQIVRGMILSTVTDLALVNWPDGK